MTVWKRPNGLGTAYCRAIEPLIIELRQVECNVSKKSGYEKQNTYNLPVVPHKAVAEVSKIGNL
jgi:hypothetical protein